MYDNKRREREDKILAWILGIGLLATLLCTNLLMWYMQ